MYFKLLHFSFKLSRKRLIFLLVFSIFGLVLCSLLSTVNAQRTDGPLFETIHVSIENDSDEAIIVDGQTDSAWALTLSNTYTISDFEFEVKIMHDADYLYLLIVPSFNVPKTLLNESLYLYLASAEVIENQTLNQDAQMDFDSNFNPPAMPTERPDMTDIGQDFQQFTTSLMEIDLSQYDDVKRLSLIGGFDNPGESEYDIVRRDSYVYTTFDEEEPYSVERDFDQNDLQANVTLNKFERTFEFGLKLNPGDANNDVNISNTEAITLTIGYTNSNFKNISYSRSIHIQFFDPSIVVVDDADISDYSRIFVYIFFIGSIVLFTVGAFSIYGSKENLKNPSIWSAIQRVNKHFKDEEEFGKLRTLEELKEINQEEREFLSQLNIEKLNIDEEDSETIILPDDPNFTEDLEKFGVDGIFEDNNLDSEDDHDLDVLSDSDDPSDLDVLSDSVDDLNEFDDNNQSDDKLDESNDNIEIEKNSFLNKNDTNSTKISLKPPSPSLKSNEICSKNDYGENISKKNASNSLIMRKKNKRSHENKKVEKNTSDKKKKPQKHNKIELSDEKSEEIWEDDEIDDDTFFDTLTGSLDKSNLFKEDEK